jgi:mRNA interferase RelE/StbE
LKYRIAFKKSVTHDLKRISKPQVKIILNKIEKELSVKADKYPELKGQFAGLRKCRIGDYRVIFSIIKDMVLITRIKHTKDAYK